MSLLVFTNIIYLRKILDENSYTNVKIIASSGFTPAKCKLFSVAKVPIDIIGTGSYIPDLWEETYATSDIIRYNGKNLVKKGVKEILIFPLYPQFAMATTETIVDLSKKIVLEKFPNIKLKFIPLRFNSLINIFDK